EKALGVRVLERTTRRIALTAAGRLIYPHAKRVVDEADAARAVIARLQGPIEGPLRGASVLPPGSLAAPSVPLPSSVVSGVSWILYDEVFILLTFSFSCFKF